METTENEVCEVCAEKVQYCDCQRCFECGTLYSASTAEKVLDDENICKVCNTKELLKDRKAVCSCGAAADSSPSLAFFEYRGPGSKSATELCQDCGYHKIVHQPINPSTGRPGITTHEFTPRGDVGTDLFYCGCNGWD
jgi:hypothetical protein